jgi:hypothetical protein
MEDQWIAADDSERGGGVQGEARCALLPTDINICRRIGILGEHGDRVTRTAAFLAIQHAADGDLQRSIDIAVTPDIRPCVHRPAAENVQFEAGLRPPDCYRVQPACCQEMASWSCPIED